MSGYLSNLLTTTTSRYNSLRRTLLSDEADGDTEDDTHITRVLRAYYTEKGRSFPQWLPPDPKKSATASQPSSTYQSIWQTGSSQQPSPYIATTSNAASSSRGALSDLWDPQPPRTSSPQPTSLRRQPGQRPSPVPPQESLAPPVQSRPLPSQRANSHQNQPQRPQSEPSPPPSSGGQGTAQERLKARLRGTGRAGSPSFNTSSGGSGRASPYQQSYGDSAGGRWG